jgi:hypothetical protein
VSTLQVLDFAEDQGATAVLLGDLGDRGEMSFMTVALIATKIAGEAKCYCSRGNHEDEATSSSYDRNVEQDIRRLVSLSLIMEEMNMVYLTISFCTARALGRHLI